MLENECKKILKSIGIIKKRLSGSCEFNFIGSLL